MLLHFVTRFGGLSLCRFSTICLLLSSGYRRGAGALSALPLYLL
jgi:hypothetical protein